MVENSTADLVMRGGDAGTVTRVGQDQNAAAGVAWNRFTKRGLSWLVGAATVTTIFVAGCGTGASGASPATADETTTAYDVPATTTPTTTVAPPPPPATQQPAPPPVTLPPATPEPAPRNQCDPNYSGCVPIASDVDCAGGSGNGPAYVDGPVNVIGSDIYKLDNDHDGVACE